MTTQPLAQDASDATPDLPWRDISELEPSDDEHWFLRRDGFGDWVIDGPRATQNHSEDEEDGWQWFAPCESPPVRARELQQALASGDEERSAVVGWRSATDFPPCREGKITSETVLVRSKERLYYDVAYYDWKPLEKECMQAMHGDFKPQFYGGAEQWMPIDEALRLLSNPIARPKDGIKE